MSDPKKFGLVMPKKADMLKTRINSIFNDDSDEEETGRKRPKIPQKKMIQKSSLKTESDIDSTIYEYDSIYDEMKTKQAESRGPKEVKKSRYIETLLKAADKRKKQYERRIDRKIQVEREKEGDQFKDKEAFVTSSYKKKLLEKEEEEERERRENMLNEMMDVTKQKDLSGFYRHFLNQSIGEEKVPLFGERQIKKEVESDHESTSNKVDAFVDKAENLDRDSDGIEIDNEDDDSEKDFSCDEKSDGKKQKLKVKKTDKYRNKKKLCENKSCGNDISEDLEKPKSSKQDKMHSRKMNINSDTDDSSSEYDGNEFIKPSQSDKNKEKNESTMNKLNVRHDSSSDDEHSTKISDDIDKHMNMSKENKQKSIFTKRTVGDAFSEAQARYFQRMATRNS